MEKIQVVEHDGTYSCDIGISKEEWLTILQDKYTSDKVRDTLLCFYYMPGHRGSCSAVGKKMGRKPNSLNMTISQFGKCVCKKCKEPFEVYGTDGEQTFWIIPMNNGKGLSSKDVGSFEWELRKELAEAIKDYLYWYLIEQYKNIRQEIPIQTNGRGYELYKWQLITASRGKTPFQIVTDHVAHSGTAALGGFENLIDAARDNKTLKRLVSESPKEYESILNRLIEEGTPLVQRLIDFKKSTSSLLPEKGYNSKANDERTAATILTCVNPDKYTFYKHDDLYNRFCKYLGVGMEKAGLCYSHYLTLIAPLVSKLQSDVELQTLVTPSLSGMRSCNLLLAQDILWVMMVSFTDRLGYIYNLLFNKPKDMDNNKKLSDCIELLKANHNLILTGAPGTGKTFMAKEIAKKMGCAESEIGFVQFHPSYDYTDFVEGFRPKNDDNGNAGFERKDGVFKEFCEKALKNFVDSKKSIQTLQQETSVRDLIEDFVEEAIENGTEYKTSGTKNAFHIIENKERSIIVEIPANEKTKEVSLPKSDLIALLENKVNISGGKDIQTYFKRKYRTQPDSYVYVLYNHLKKISTKTKKVEVSLIPLKNFVFIIDEINRGEISKIFGELFFSIDPGYRGEKGKVQTQYQNMIEEGDVFKNGFYVPENVYIIGTMNDIDRSVESMDFAMRRRFSWQEVNAEESYDNMIAHDADFAAVKDEIKQRMFNLNKAIAATEGLDENYQIGAAYFRKILDYNGQSSPFDCLWSNHLKGLLAEYLRGSRKAKEILEKLHEAYNQTDTYEQPAHTNEG